MLTEVQRRAILNGMIAEDGLLDGAKLRLFKNNVTVTPAAAIGSLTACDFSGYADSAALEWTEPSIQPGTNEYMLSNVAVEFRSNTATPYVPGTARGWALITGDGATLLAAGNFDAPVEFDVAERSLQLVLALTVRSLFAVPE